MTCAEPTFFASALEFRSWLEQHSGRAAELIVGYWKVDSGRPSMTWSESVDEALCYGWIDGVRRRIDEHSYQIRFTPRKPGSIWSAVNIAKIGSLRAQGRMTEAGELAYACRVEAKSVVYAYEQEAPREFTRAENSEFRKNKVAWKFFEGCPPSYRKVLQHWVTSAKKPETRASRLRKLIEASSEGKRLR